MNNTTIFILSLLNIVAELTELAYDLGAVTRKYGVPALVAIYVASDILWDKLTSFEMSIPTYRRQVVCAL